MVDKDIKTAAEVADFLKEHNNWRRGGEGEMQSPKELGEMIESAITHLTALTAYKEKQAVKQARLESKELVEEVQEAILPELMETIAYFEGCQVSDLKEGRPRAFAGCIAQAAINTIIGK